MFIICVCTRHRWRSEDNHVDPVLASLFSGLNSGYQACAASTFIIFVTLRMSTLLSLAIWLRALFCHCKVPVPSIVRARHRVYVGLPWSERTCFSDFLCQTPF